LGPVNCDAERKRSQWSAQTAAPQPPLPPPAATPAEKLAGGSQDQQAKHRTALTQPCAAASPKAAQPCAADAAQQVSAARPSSSGNRPGRLSLSFFLQSVGELSLLFPGGCRLSPAEMLSRVPHSRFVSMHGASAAAPMVKVRRASHPEDRLKGRDPGLQPRQFGRAQLGQRR
jgi:hypothetical protein